MLLIDSNINEKWYGLIRTKTQIAHLNRKVNPEENWLNHLNINKYDFYTA